MQEPAPRFRRHQRGARAALREHLGVQQRRLRREHEERLHGPREGEGAGPGAAHGLRRLAQRQGPQLAESPRAREQQQPHRNHGGELRLVQVQLQSPTPSQSLTLETCKCP